jgi:aspartate racemase
MKRLGLIGGMSWESTQAYYSGLNEGVRARQGGLHSANLVLISVDFAPIAAAQQRGDWGDLASRLQLAADQLANAGAELLMICTNTMHKVAPEVAAHTALPLLHIGDASGAAVVDRGCRSVGLLGTRFTMQEAFYRDYLTQHYGLKVHTPESAQQDLVHRIIFEELCQGRVEAKSRAIIQAIIEQLVENGAEAILLGCTELGLLIPESERPVPILDTTRLHVDYALNAAMATSKD